MAATIRVHTRRVVSPQSGSAQFESRGFVKGLCCHPTEAIDVLATRDHAHRFRDIGSYLSWDQRADGTVQCSYAARGGMGLVRGTVNVTLRRAPRTLHFSGNGLGIEVEGAWMAQACPDGTTHLALASITRVTSLAQHFPGLRRMLEARSKRALEDVRATFPPA